MTWVEGKEGREETLLPSKHTEQLLYLPQGVCFPPPPHFSILSSPHTLERNFYSTIISPYRHEGNKARPLKQMLFSQGRKQLFRAFLEVNKSI